MKATAGSKHHWLKKPPSSKAECEQAEHMAKAIARRTEIDWLAVAIWEMGGVGPSAKALEVSQATICRWLGKGMAGVRFSTVKRLSKLGGIPMEALRLGPFKETPLSHLAPALRSVKRIAA